EDPKFYQDLSQPSSVEDSKYDESDSEITDPFSVFISQLDALIQPLRQSKITQSKHPATRQHAQKLAQRQAQMKAQRPVPPPKNTDSRRSLALEFAGVLWWKAEIPNLRNIWVNINCAQKENSISRSFITPKRDKEFRIRLD